MVDAILERHSEARRDSLCTGAEESGWDVTERCLYIYLLLT